MCKKKYMLVVGGVLVFLVFIIGILSVTVNYVRLNRERTLRELEEDIKAGSEQLQFYLESLQSHLLGIKRHLRTTDMKVDEELYSDINFIRAHHSDAVQEILILDVNGKVVAGTNPASAQSSFQESKYFKNTQHISNKVYLSEAIVVSDLLGRPEVDHKIFMDPLDLGFMLCTGVYSKGVFRGAVLFVVRFEPFFNRYSMALTKLTSGYGFIVQEDGRILFHREVELRGKFISDLPESSDLIKANDLLKNSEGKTFGYRATGQHIIVISEVYLENRRWTVGISTTTSKLAQKTLTTIYTLSGLLLLFGIIIFWLIFSLIRLTQAKEMIGESEERLRYLSSQLISAQEEERRRISLELHDEMGQALTAIGLNLESIMKELPPEHAAMIKGKLDETISLTEQASDRIRDLSLDLRPSMLDDLGLLPTLRWYINSHEKRTETPVIFEAINLGERLSPEVEIVLYRIVQESLNNITKHARAKKVKIRLEQKKKKVGVFIEDDGIGFHPDQGVRETAPVKGIGLLGMHERVRLLGGSFRVRSHKSHGTSIFAELPLN